jgi:hypothetical protein
MLHDVTASSAVEKVVVMMQIEAES